MWTRIKGPSGAGEPKPRDTEAGRADEQDDQLLRRYLRGIPQDCPYL